MEKENQLTELELGLTQLIELDSSEKKQPLNGSRPSGVVVLRGFNR